MQTFPSTAGKVHRSDAAVIEEEEDDYDDDDDGGNLVFDANLVAMLSE